MAKAIENVRAAFPGTEFVDTIVAGEHVRTCRKCGCTDLQSCEGGCHWKQRNLCSSSHGAVA